MRCYASYALSLLGSVHIAHRPMFVSVEPSAVCQLRCPECPVGQGGVSRQNSAVRPPFMSSEVWQRTLDEIKRYAHTVQFYFQGEPLLNPNLPQMISQAHAEGLYTIVSTNAQAMTEPKAEALVGAGLDRIIVSMDGLTEESYNAYRVGGSLAKTKEALRMLRAAKRRLRATITIAFKTAQLYNYTHGHPLMPSDPRYSRYIATANSSSYHRRPLHRGCLRVWSGVVITTEGEVLPCCYDKAHAYAYGNIMNAPLRELFSNEKALAFRRAALRETPQICQECWR